VSVSAAGRLSGPDQGVRDDKLWGAAVTGDRHLAIRQLVRALGLDSSAASIESVAASVGTSMGRRVVLRPSALDPHGVSGAWLEMQDEDVILFETTTSPRHQAQIIAHELGHMVCGHAGTAQPAGWHQLDLAAGAADHMLARHGYEDTDERDAELVADLLLAHVDTASTSAPTDPVTAALLKP